MQIFPIGKLNRGHECKIWGWDSGKRTLASAKEGTELHGERAASGTPHSPSLRWPDPFFSSGDSALISLSLTRARLCAVIMGAYTFFKINRPDRSDPPMVPLGLLIAQRFTSRLCLSTYRGEFCRNWSFCYCKIYFKYVFLIFYYGERSTKQYAVPYLIIHTKLVFRTRVRL